ncbi:MAG: protein kinase [Candidatus Riflebacteria bacterium]|nr:protein kinase [Candidatus Riflebacteria bacterium]
MSSPLPPRCAEKFEVERLIASGGFGSVYLATQRSLDRPVALKVLHAETLIDPSRVTRFKDEARITASLAHPNIVVILEFGVDQGIPWIAYEFLPGRSMRALLEEKKTLRWPDALRGCSQVAAALEEAHGKGVLHRDVKPENVIEFAPGSYKVTDFGIAKWGEGCVETQHGVILGTPAYLAREQISDQATTGSDLYALGVMLFELVTGHLPFDHENPLALLQLHLTSAIPVPSSFVPEVPESVDRIVAQAMAKRPEERFASAKEMGEAMQKALTSPGRPTARQRPVQERRRITSSAPTLMAHPAGPQPDAAGRETAVTRRPPGGPMSRPWRSAPLLGALAALLVAAGSWAVMDRPGGSSLPVGSGFAGRSPGQPESPSGSPRRSVEPSLPEPGRLEVSREVADLMAGFVDRGSVRRQIRDQYLGDPTHSDFRETMRKSESVVGSEGKVNRRLTALMGELTSRYPAVAATPGPELRLLCTIAAGRFITRQICTAFGIIADTVRAGEKKNPGSLLTLRLVMAELRNQESPQLVGAFDGFASYAAEWTRRMAAEPDRVSADELGDLWTLVYRVGTYVADANWPEKAGDPRSAAAIALTSFKRSLGATEGPAATRLVPVIQKVFSWKHETPPRGGSVRRWRQGRLTELLQAIDQLRPLMPGAAGALDGLVVQLRDDVLGRRPAPPSPSAR